VNCPLGFVGGGGLSFVGLDPVDWGVGTILFNRVNKRKTVEE